MTAAGHLDTVADRWRSHPFCEALDIHLESLEEGAARFALHRATVNVAGVRDSINGGILASYVELAAHAALETLLGAGERIAHTQDLGLSYTSSARGERTIAEARVLRRGRLSVVDVRIFDAADGTLNCQGRVSAVIER